MEEEGETGEGLGRKRKVRRIRFRKRKEGDDGDTGVEIFLTSTLNCFNS